MKILVAGDGHSKIHERAVADSFKETGHEVIEFFWHHYFQGKGLVRLFRRIEERLIIGPDVIRLNSDFEKAIYDFQPEVVFIYRGVMVSPSTLSKIKRRMPKVVVVGYNNDDPFSPIQSKVLWRKFLGALSIYDLVFAYRPGNVIEYLQHGARKSELLKPWYSKNLHFPVLLGEEDKQKFECEVAFIGHYEDDGRAAFISKLLAEGIKVRIFGPMTPGGGGWMLALKEHPELKALLPTGMLWGQDYNKAILGAKITLCFLSKLNRDKYTRRCFEIPAVGGFLFSEYTEELDAMLTEGKEAEYFRDLEEFMRKIKYYLQDEEQRASIAAAGHKRMTSEGNDNIARSEQIVRTVKHLQAQII